MFNKLPTWVVAVILLISLATQSALNQTGADSSELVIRTLQPEGTDDIRVQRGGPGHCSDSEAADDFVAIQNKQSVSGVVCVDVKMETAYTRYR